MQQWIDAVTALYTQWKGVAPVSLDVLPQSGSERRYFRLHGGTGSDGGGANGGGSGALSVIGTYGNNIRENETFFYFSGHFREKGLAVPEILAISEDRQFYLQEDFGDESLLWHLESKGQTPEVYELFKKTVVK